MSYTFNTTFSNWQGVDIKPMPNSKNFAESGGIDSDLEKLEQNIFVTKSSVLTCTSVIDGKVVSLDGTLVDISDSAYSVRTYTLTAFQVRKVIHIKFFKNFDNPQRWVVSAWKNGTFVKGLLKGSNRVVGNSELDFDITDIDCDTIYASVSSVIEHNTENYTLVDEEKDRAEQAEGNLENKIDEFLGIETTSHEQETDVVPVLHVNGYYIGNGVGIPLSEEIAASSRAIYKSTGWQKGDIIRIPFLRAGGTSSCAIAIYKNGAFIKNLLSGNGGVVISSSTDFTPTEDFDEIRFSLSSNSTSNITLKRVKIIKESNSSVLHTLDETAEKVDILKDILDVREEVLSVSKTATLYKIGYYIGNGIGVPLGSEQESSSRAIYNSTGWQQGDTIRLSFLRPAGSSSCAIALYKNSSFVKNVLSGKDGNVAVISEQTDFTPEEDFDEVRFSLASNVDSNISGLTLLRDVIYSKEIDDIKEDVAELKMGKPLKVLLIGSSFGVNTIIQFPFICKSADVDVICGNLYRGACTSADIVDIINEDKSWEIGRIFLPNNGVWTTATKDFETMLKYTDWDIIILQRGRNESKTWTQTMESNFQIIVEYIRDNVTGTPEIFINTLFADPVYSTDKTVQISNTNLINSTAKQMQDSFGFEIIPVATAVQNARMTNLIGFGSVDETIPDMAEDSIHLDTGIGSYVTGAVLFEYIIGKRFGKSIIANSYMPTSADIYSMGIFPQAAYTQPTLANINVMKYCALLACRTPDIINTVIGTRYPYISV